MTAVLEVEGLTVGYARREGGVDVVVRDVDLRLHAGRTLGIAGESGCGKSTAVLAAVGFAAPGARRLAGASRLRGLDLFTLERGALRAVWGRSIAYVAQDAAGALNPRHRVGRQIAEVLELHAELTRAETRERVLSMLEAVGIPDPPEAAERYPWQFSGGQQQRIALAAAMVAEPEVLVLDEPTTGLDVTTQAQITSLIARLVERTGTAALHISHDLAMLAANVDDLAVMYAGEIVERGPVRAVADAPRHPYTAALLDAVPRVEDAAPVAGIPGRPPPKAIEGACSFAPRCAHAQPRCTAAAPALRDMGDGLSVRCVRTEELGRLAPRRDGETGRAIRHGGDDGGPLLSVRDVRCEYHGRGSATVAVDGVSLEVSVGETLAVVGESGSGKSTLLRAIAGLHAPAGGEMLLRGTPLAGRVLDRPRDVRRAVQLVFQNPDASLNPMHAVGASVERPLALFAPQLTGAERRRRVLGLLADVRLDPEIVDRRPHELSGGQRQRVALARAFAADPALLLCDEVVSALDVSVQATVLDVLARLVARTGTAVLFVTHDLGVVRQVADRVAIMRAGSICETGPANRIFEAPEHDYTRALLAAVPKLDRRLAA